MEVADQDIMVVPKEVPIHKGIDGSWHHQWGRLAIPTIPCEGGLDPVNDGRKIHLGSGIKNVPSEYLL